MVEAEQSDCLESGTRQHPGIEFDHAAANGLPCLVGTERITALRLRQRRIGDGNRLGQALCDHRNFGTISALQLDLDLAYPFAASVGLDVSAIECQLQLGFIGMKRENRAVDHSLENRLS